jgi:5-formyltetrahydrofolate cyclo-ligase
VSCYLSMPTGEVDTSSLVSEILHSGKWRSYRSIGHPLAHTLIAAGKSLFVPKIIKTTDSHMEFWKIYSQDDLDTLPSGVWGIKEPSDQWQDENRLSGPVHSFIPPSTL